MLQPDDISGVKAEVLIATVVVLFIPGVEATVEKLIAGMATKFIRVPFAIEPDTRKSFAIGLRGKVLARLDKL